MENYLVSARKYRPATFESVVGQAGITITLKNAIRQNQLAQAFLFCGPRGVGKTTCARILAKTINCQHITSEVEACDACDSCKSFNANSSFNIFELDAASNNTVDDIRNLIDQVRIPPQASRYKVYIIDEVHMLSQAAFNAFLKTLEEPPAYAKFILATTEKHKVLPTILSRCQVFDFRRISVEDIIKQLTYVAAKQEIEVEDDALHIIAQKADGSMRDALSIFDQIVSFSGTTVSYASVIENLNVLDHEYYFRLTDLILTSEYGSALLLLNDVIDRGFEGQHFLNGFSVHLRNLLVGQDAATIRLLEVGESIRAKYTAQAARCQVSFLMKALEICNQFDLNYRISNNKRLHLEILLVQLSGIAAPGKEMPAAKAAVPRKTPEVMITIDPKLAPAMPAAAPVIPTAVAAPVTPDTAMAPSPAPSANGSLGMGRLSIKDLRQDLSREKPCKPEELDPAEGKTERFDQEALEKCWLNYAEGFKNELPSLYSTLIRRMPQLQEDFQLNFMVDNKYQEDLLLGKKTEILHHLKSVLKNKDIGLILQVTDVKQDERPYTAVDKYKKIAGNNPAIQILKDQLNLELDI